MREIEGTKTRPYGLDYRLNGKRYRPNFATKAERNEHRREIEAIRAKKAIVLQGEDLEFYREARRQQGRLSSTPISQAVDFFNEHYLRLYTGAGDTRLGEAARDYERELEMRGTQNLTHVKGTLKLLMQSIDDGQYLAVVSRDAIQAWIDKLYQDSAYGNVTVKNHHKRVHAFFQRQLELGKIDKNPCAYIALKKVETKEALIMPVSRLKEHIAKNIKIDSSYCGIEMLLFMTGIRVSMIAPAKQKQWRIDKNMFYPKERMLIVPSKVMKIDAGRDLVLDDLSENVFKWVELIKDSDWHIMNTTFANRRNRAINRSGVWIPANCARKSAGTYQKIYRKSREQAASRLGHHGNTAMFSRHYEGYKDYDNHILTEDLAVEYLAISPDDF